MPSMNRMVVVRVRVRVRQINEVGVVKLVDFFVRVFVHDVRYKYNLSLFLYTCAIVHKTL